MLHKHKSLVGINVGTEKYTIAMSNEMTSSATKMLIKSTLPARFTTQRSGKKVKYI